ncbi:MAG TPA: PilZ domain-containing protein [Pyrinomonadaceae bacterium]|nr:PilZ domain-containing protein [Pyrinomonadaceae bacterium]
MTPTETTPARPMGRPIPVPAPEKENRRIQRISLPLPVRVEVRVDRESSWYEITRLSDVSAFGCGFEMKRPVKRGRLVLLTIPMPRQLRSFDHAEPQYRVWGLVRRCISTGSAVTPQYAVGVAFIGKNPPAGYIEHPSRLYELMERNDEGGGLWHIGQADLRADDRHLPNELRKQTRYFIPEPVIIEQTDENGNVTSSEQTVTENISLGGAAVFSTVQSAPGTFVRFISERHQKNILSVVRGSRVGPDGITRLHLEFVDSLFPLEGIVN